MCCELCATAKGSLSGDEWRHVLAALRATEPAAAKEAVGALAAGRVVAVEQGKVLPRGVPSRVTRQRRRLSSN